MDLRERRKKETSVLIRLKALEIFGTHGADALTVEAICAAAGISQRTFFNYFPYKEAALVLPPPPLSEKMIADFLGSDGDLFEDLADLFAAQADLISEDRWLFSVLPRIADAFPKLVPLQMAEFHTFDAQIASLIARRTGWPEDDVGCRVLAESWVSANKAALDAWLKTESGSMADGVRSALLAAVAVADSARRRP